MPEVVDIIKIKVDSQPQLGSLANVLSIEMHAMPTWRKVAYALQRELIVEPQRSDRIGFCMQRKK